jgi:hypothetical protein
MDKNVKEMGRSNEMRKYEKKIKIKIEEIKGRKGAREVNTDKKREGHMKTT